MAKIQLKSDNINPFGGLFSIFNQFDRSGILRTMRNLSCENVSYESDKRKSYDFNVNENMNSLLLRCLSVTGQLNPGDCVDLDFDHQFIPSFAIIYTINS